MIADNKTKPTLASVEQYLDAIGDEGRRDDCKTLIKLMSQATKQDPKMWGAAIVGFGELKYKYASGRVGETCLIGFSSRKSAITIYGTGSASRRDNLLGKLGKHTTGKGCLYVKKLSDVQIDVLDALITSAVTEKRRS